MFQITYTFVKSLKKIKGICLALCWNCEVDSAADTQYLDSV